MDDSIKKTITLYNLKSLEDVIHLLKGEHADNQTNKYKIFFETKKMVVIIQQSMWFEFHTQSGGHNITSLLNHVREGNEQAFDNTFLRPLIEKEQLENCISDKEQKKLKFKI